MAPKPHSDDAKDRSQGPGSLPRSGAPDGRRALARRMAERCRLVALTRGQKAVTVFEQNDENDVPIEPVEQVRDTTGAGDVFIALLGLRLIAGQSVRAAVMGAARGATRYVAEGLPAVAAGMPAVAEGLGQRR